MNFDVPSRGHQDPCESVRTAYGIIFDGSTNPYGGNLRAHTALQKLPAVMADGLGEALPDVHEYRQSMPASFAPIGPSGITPQFYEREARGFTWFIDPSEWLVGGDE